MSVKTIQAMVYKYLEKIGLNAQGYSCHKLRHTAATLMYQGGVDMLALKEILGHESVSTTQIYTQVAIRKLQQLKKLKWCQQQQAILSKPSIQKKVTICLW